MIAIINIKPGEKENSPSKYEVKINNKHITYFYHTRKDGLSVCLEKAAEAVKKASIKNIKVKKQWITKDQFDYIFKDI